MQHQTKLEVFYLMRRCQPSLSSGVASLKPPELPIGAKATAAGLSGNGAGTPALPTGVTVKATERASNDPPPSKLRQYLFSCAADLC